MSGVGTIYLDVMDAAGNRLGAGPVTSVKQAEITRALDGAGSFRVECSATDPRALDLLREERRINIYRQEVSGYKLKAGGLIQTVGIADGVSGATLNVEGLDLLAELKRQNVLLARIFNQASLQSVADDLIGLVPNWTVELDAALDEAVVDARYDGVSVLKAFQHLADQYGYHLRIKPGTARTLQVSPFGELNNLRIEKVETLTPETLANALLLPAKRMDSSSSSQNMFNTILSVGQGEGESMLTMEKSTRSIANGDPYDIQTVTGPDGRTIYYLQDAASVAMYGVIWRSPAAQFKDIAPLSNAEVDQINAANALYDATVYELEQFKQPVKSYTTTVVNPQENIQPGDKIHIRYKAQVLVGGQLIDYLFVQGDFWIMRLSERMGETGAAVDLEISNIDRFEKSVAEEIVAGLEQIESRNLKPGTSSPTRSYVYQRTIAPSFSARIPIEFTNATKSVKRVRIRLETDSFRATAKSGQATTSSSGGGGSVTSASGGGTSATSSSTTHDHLVARILGSGSGFVTRDLQVVDSNGTVHYLRVETTAPNGTAFETNTDGNHNHTVTIPNHTHDITIPAHTHDIGAIPLVFGITDDSQTPSGITLHFGGSDVTNDLTGSATLAPSGGAINLVLDEGEMTSLIENASGGLRQRHQLEVRCSGGQGRIEATVEVSETTQDIAYI